MILTCPSCGTRFQIELTSLGPKGRQVRCGGCGHSWREMPSPPAEAVVAPAKPPAKAAPALAAAESSASPEASAAAGSSAATESSGGVAPLEEFDAARRRGKDRARDETLNREPEAAAKGGRLALVAGWAALILFLVGLGAGAWFGREAIVAQVPAAAKLYAMAGIPVVPESRLGEGLELRDVTTSKQVVDGEQTLHIKGEVVNLSGDQQPVPTLKAVITDAEGVSVAEWTFTAEAGDLPPGGSALFETSTREPESGANLSLIFVDNRS